MDREEKVRFVKNLITGRPAACPDCPDTMVVPLHPRRKSKNGDINYKCPKCGKIYRPSHMVPIE